MSYPNRPSPVPTRSTYLFCRYAIRGCQYRDPLLWVAALDTALQLGAELLVPQHTRPLAGRDQVRCHSWLSHDKEILCRSARR